MKERTTFHAQTQSPRALKKLLNFTGPERAMADKKKPAPEEEETDLEKAAAWAKFADDGEEQETVNLDELLYQHAQHITPEQYDQERGALLQEYMQQGFSLPQAERLVRQQIGDRQQFERAYQRAQPGTEIDPALWAISPGSAAAQSLAGGGLGSAVGGLGADLAFYRSADPVARTALARMGVRTPFGVSPGMLRRGRAQALRGGLQGRIGSQVVRDAARQAINQQGARGGLLRQAGRSLARNPVGAVSRAPFSALGRMLGPAGVALSGASELANKQGLGGLLWTAATGDAPDAYHQAIDDVVDRRVAAGEGPGGFWSDLGNTVLGAGAAGIRPFTGMGGGQVSKMQEAIGRRKMALQNWLHQTMPSWYGSVAKAPVIGAFLPNAEEGEANWRYINRAQEMGREQAERESDDIRELYQEGTTPYAFDSGQSTDLEALRRWREQADPFRRVTGSGSADQYRQWAATRDYRSNIDGDQQGNTYWQNRMEAAGEDPEGRYDSSAVGGGWAMPGDPLRQMQQEIDSEAAARERGDQPFAGYGYNPYNPYAQAFTDEQWQEHFGDRMEDIRSSIGARQTIDDVQTGAMSRSALNHILGSHSDQQLEDIYGGQLGRDFSYLGTRDRMQALNEYNEPVWNLTTLGEQKPVDWDAVQRPNPPSGQYQVAEGQQPAQAPQQQPAQAPQQQPAQAPQQQPVAAPPPSGAPRPQRQNRPAQPSYAAR